jgi:hypothetical protein
VLAAIHEAMRRDTPAAAYLFARTLYNARPCVENSKLRLHQKIGVIEKELCASEASTQADAGILALALRFIRGTLEEVERAGFGGLNTAFGEVVKYGERYRELSEHDHRPPESRDARAILEKSGYECLAELVRAVRTGYAGMESGDNASADEDVWTLHGAI